MTPCQIGNLVPFTQAISVAQTVAQNTDQLVHLTAHGLQRLMIF